MEKCGRWVGSVENGSLQKCGLDDSKVKTHMYLGMVEAKGMEIKSRKKERCME